MERPCGVSSFGFAVCRLGGQRHVSARHIHETTGTDGMPTHTRHRGSSSSPAVACLDQDRSSCHPLHRAVLDAPCYDFRHQRTLPQRDTEVLEPRCQHGSDTREGTVSLPRQRVSKIIVYERRMNVLGLSCRRTAVLYPGYTRERADSSGPPFGRLCVGALTWLQYPTPPSSEMADTANATAAMAAHRPVCWAAVTAVPL